ncbi:hypothetical protein ACJX0J_021370, partial [Zea mays]
KVTMIHHRLFSFLNFLDRIIQRERDRPRPVDIRPKNIVIFKWALVAVYGPAQDDRKEAFLTKTCNQIQPFKFELGWKTGQIKMYHTREPTCLLNVSFKKHGIILKLDFEKAYDKIKGFSYIWCSWISAVMTGDHVGINFFCFGQAKEVQQQYTIETKIEKKFFWQGDNHKKKYRLANTLPYIKLCALVGQNLSLWYNLVSKLIQLPLKVKIFMCDLSTSESMESFLGTRREEISSRYDPYLQFSKLSISDLEMTTKGVDDDTTLFVVKF